MAATQRDRSEVLASHRSIIPSVPGVPAGAAVLIAVACTFIGFFIDAGGSGKELTHVFAACYILGCVLAALVVRYRGLFTAMVTPPLLLFVAVPLAYQQLIGHSSTSVKDVLLNLAIPLVNRFPLMAIATLLVLAIGGVRVYMHRQDEGPRKGGDRSRTGDSRGPRPSSAERARRNRPAASTETPRRRGRSDAAPKPDPDASARTTRRTTGKTAERPPRVAPGSGYSRGSERAAADPPRRTRDRYNGDVPPHPRPNVRYRERDSGRIER
ncbi:hypothetical protein NDR87_17075 [Nocardia sp. CDC159]|uniref:DUF6542 domain-containing protein n=1 Tax=Nocardia pulmonis TaxID=2951408 RepID=A0A9X2E879_9NOCA|nr:MULTISPECIES: DUF6542 domain-containing protein [Nocardia]MCM6775952.1 hypothetical protein [Nocardia pulmonis]MCM6788072.1 hypothetical protein [Nocardia sp. CDC159]